MKIALTCSLFLSTALALGACSSSSPSASTPPGVSTSTAPLGGSEGPTAPPSATPAPPVMPSADVPSPAASGAGRGGAVTVTPEQRTCAKDDDCVGVQTTCCDVCNGGTLEAVNRSSSAAVQAAKGKLACQGVACTMRGCTPKTPVCRSGACAMP